MNQHVIDQNPVTSSRRWRLPLVLVVAALLAGSTRGADIEVSTDADPEIAARILKETKTSGGLIVHLGSGDGKLTAALGASGNVLIHGLDANTENIRKARDYVRSLNMYGNISFDRLGEKLPYIDNLVNLVICEEDAISAEEIQRVLAPGGQVYYLPEGRTERKPPMSGIDDWTHFMHDSTGNAVANDALVSPPKYLKWVGGSTWSRSHGNMGNMPGLIASNGRIFSIVDEGFVGKDQEVAPAVWSLVARDAYNGVVLWRKPINTWHDAFWGKKSGPPQLPERMVADAERVYVTLDINGPVSALDAVTGNMLFECADSVGTEEILINDRVLFLLRNPLRESGEHTEPIRALTRGLYNGGSPYGENEKEIMAVDALTGKVLWKKTSVVLATTLAVDGKQVYFHDGTRIVCLDRNDGTQKWISAPVERIKPVPARYTPVLVVQEDVVLFVGGLRYDGNGEGKDECLNAYDANSGRKLWEGALPSEVYSASAPYGVFVIDGLVWTGDVAGGGQGKVGGNPYTGRDLHTGEVVKSITRDIGYLRYHSRCYPNKATVNYLMPNIRGVEMVDIANEKWTGDLWIRGGCAFGIMPSHGMIYVPPHACTCYAQSKLTGFNAVYGDGVGATKVVADPQKVRLERGSTETDPASRKEALNAAGAEWPTYRGNNKRSGSVKSAVSGKLSTAWKLELGGKLSAVTIANGRVFVSQIDQHDVHAIDAESGRGIWRFTAGGRIDSPPTLYRGKAYFGCTDGYVYCLDASEGSLIWKFLAAADDRRLVSHGQLESVHPVHGSVLIREGVLYFVAGRSMFLDGGLRFYRLDADTGEELSVNVMDRIDPFTQKTLLEKTINQTMPPSMPDILSCDEQYVYMGVQRFDLMGNRTEVETHLGNKNWDAVFALHKRGGAHLFSPAGFLDDARFHRSRWIYGTVYFGGHQDEWRADRVAPAGNILVFDDQNVLGYYGAIQIGTQALRNSLFSVSKDAVPERILEETDSEQQEPLEHNWIIKSPIYVNSMLLTDRTLFVAGATENDAESLLYSYSAANGAKLTEYALPAMPVFDGMACTAGSIYIALKDGSVICMKEE